MITTVTSSAALYSALKVAQGGDTILLAPGAYTPIAINGMNFTSEVTIASADATRPAVLSGFTITSSSGLAFENLELRTDLYTSFRPYQIGGSHDLRFSGLDVHGSLDNNPQNDRTGFLVRTSKNVTIEDSEFHELNVGIAHLDDSHLTIRGNKIHDIQLDGIRGGGSSYVTITGNTLSDFYPVAGDHPDAIQFWTTNTTVAAHDITITDNVIVRGDGARMQGIFIGDEVGTLPYTNVTISGNFVAGTMYHGIALGHGKNVTVTDNVVTGFSDMRSWILVQKTDGATITGNSANSFTLGNAVTNATIGDNTVVALSTDQGAAAYAAWLADTTAAAPEPAPAPAPAPAPVGDQTVTGDAGANVLSGGSGNDTLTGGGGADTISGGAGDDLYVTGVASKVIEAANGGTDTIQSADTITLPANVENLILTGSLTRHLYGNASNNVMTGNSAGNQVQGYDGADTLDGRAGADSVRGGAGDDVLIGGAGADSFVFDRSGGNDVVRDFGANGEHDVLNLSLLLNAGLQPTVVDLGADVKISFTTGETITLLGVDPSQLTATSTGYIF